MSEAPLYSTVYASVTRRGFGVSGCGSDPGRNGVCSGSEASSDLRLIDCVYHSTLGLRGRVGPMETSARTPNASSLPAFRFRV